MLVLGLSIGLVLIVMTALLWVYAEYLERKERREWRAVRAELERVRGLSRF